MKKTLFLIINLIFIPFVNAQVTLPTEGMLSPNAASLGKYGDLPVSYYTGSVDVSIPLYTLSSKGIDLPVALHYDASGVRVNSLPSWVGQNWSLDAGGVITRSVQGGIDEYVTSVNQANPTYLEAFGVLPQYINDYETLLNFNNCDLQPDIFTFNFMGKTGKFFMGNDGHWKVSSDSNIDVVFNWNEVSSYFDYPFIEYLPDLSDRQAKTFRGFVLRDDEGNTYKFGYNKNAIEYYLDFFKQGRSISGGVPIHPSWKANSWYLTEVRDKFSNIIYQLEYERGYFLARLYNSYYRTLTTNNSDIGGAGSKTSGASDNLSLGGDLISPVYLNKITDYQNNKLISFSRSVSDIIPYSIYTNEWYNTGNKASNWPVYLLGSTSDGVYLRNLDKVTPYIYKPNGSIDYANPLNGVRMYKLNTVSINEGGIYKVYEFEYNNGDTNNNRRLNLTKLNLYNYAFYYDKSKGYISSYRFSYYNPDNLPGYLSKATDHWGYYNGVEYAAPQVYSGENLEDDIFKQRVTAFTAQRESNVQTVVTGMLHGITYPTGGTTILNYEPHSYSSVVSTDRQSMTTKSGIAGGVRIRMITEYDHDGNILKNRRFHYSQFRNGATSGQLAASPQYFWWKWKVHPVGYSNLYHTMTTFRASSIVPLSNSFGSHIGYTYVIEETLGNGYTLYKYSNFSEVFDELPVVQFSQVLSSPEDMFSEKTHLRGKLQNLKIYSNENLLKKEVIYDYRSDNPDLRSYVLSANLKRHQPSMAEGFIYYSGTVKKLYYSANDVVREETKTYEADNPAVVEIKKYTKNDRQLMFDNVRMTDVRYLDSEEFIASDNSVYKTQYHYPFQLNNPYMTDLVQSFRIALPVKTEKFKNNIAAGVQKFRYTNFSGKILPTEYLTSFRGENELMNEVSYLEYQDNGNLLTYKQKENPKETVVWGGTQKNVLLAVVSNVNSSSEVASRLNNNLLNKNYIASDQTALITEFNKLRDLLPNSMVKSYTYNGPLLTSETQPNKVSAYYEYDMTGRLISVLDNDKSILSGQEYSYSGKAPFIIELVDKNSNLQLGNKMEFQVFAVNGTGDYSIRWTLSNHSGVVYDEAVNTDLFTSRAYRTLLLLSCEVTDNVSGKTQTVSKTVSASEKKCKFVDYRYENNEFGFSYAWANIEVPVADTVVIWAQNRSTSETYIAINGVEYELGNYQSRTIEVPTGFESTIFVQLKSKSKNVNAIIQSLKGSSAPIDSNNKELRFK